MISIKKYTEKLNNIWDDFIFKSNNGTIFHTQQFLSYHQNKNFINHSLLFFDKDIPLAVLPAAVIKENNKSILYSHPGASFGGIIYTQNLNFITKMMKDRICIVYTHHKLGDLIWQLPYIKAISDHHNQKVDLVVRKKTQAKDILKDLNHINKIHYNEFRKGLAYWIDVFKLKKIFDLEKYDYVYILDKVNKPAIAAKLAGIKNIIGPGFKNQKKWITVKNYLDEKDWKLNYSEQSQKLLKINSIILNDKFPDLEVNIERLKVGNDDLMIDGKKIAFGVDSFEDYKMWFEEDFIKLADLLHEKGLFDYIYLVCGPDKSNVAKKIINDSGKKYFIDCSNKDLTGVILAIKNSAFYIGNNSGPLNLSAALGVKTFGLIANDPVSELKYSKITPITPQDYKDDIWTRNREGMKKLKPGEVLNKIINNL